jgi:hypothetical protein
MLVKMQCSRCGQGSSRRRTFADHPAVRKVGRGLSDLGLMVHTDHHSGVWPADIPREMLRKLPAQKAAAEQGTNGDHNSYSSDIPNGDEHRAVIDTERGIERRGDTS